jgi:hypothetical protein
MAAELTQLAAYGAELVTALQERIKSFPASRFGPVNASGKLAASLRYDVALTATGYRLTLYAAAYALALEYGRKPGKFPNLTAIREWIQARGLVPHPDAKGRAVSVNSLAFLIGRKIANSGTTLYQAGQPSQLFGALLSPAQVGAAITARILPQLVQELRSALQAA